MRQRTHQRGVERDGKTGVEGLDLVGGNHERAVGEGEDGNGHRDDFARRGSAGSGRRGEEQVDARRIGLGGADGRVVDLDDEVGAAKQLLAHPGGERAGAAAGHVAGEVVSGGREAEAAERGVAGAGLRGVELLRPPRGVDGDDGVVHNLLVAGPELDGFEVAVDRQQHRQHEHLVHILPVALVGEGL